MEKLLFRALDEVYEQEFIQYKKTKKHFFSFRHRRMMSRLFRQYEGKAAKTNNAPVQHKIKNKRQAALIAVVVILALLTITVTASSIYSFAFKKQADHTAAFSLNTDNVPSVIEYRYALALIPDGYKEASHTKGVAVCETIYKNENTYLALTQYVKEKYQCNYNTENFELEKTDVNGRDGFYIMVENRTVLVWDNGDYILELNAAFDKNEIIDFAKNIKAITNN